MFEQLYLSLAEVSRQTQTNLSILLTITGTLWLVYLINRFILGNGLFQFGIMPRRISGIPGILFAPFIHADFNHLFFNTIPFVVLANFMMMQGLPLFYYMSAFIIVVSGVITWLIGKPGIHIGASGVITGYWAYLLADSYQNPSIITLFVALILIYYFAGIFLGLFPSKKGVSWEGHLSGALAGAGLVGLQNLPL